MLDRDLNSEALREITNRLEKSRALFLSKVETITRETVLFSINVSRAIGEISYKEAIEGIINYFTEGMRK